MYEIILFDLDGTLVDSGIGVINSVIYSLKKYGIEVADREELNKFMGPPLHESYQDFYGFSEEEAKTAVEYYREYYRDKAIFEYAVYEGIEDLLRTLSDAGKTLVVATSKPEVFAKEILAHAGLSKYFAYIAGANLDGSRTKKDEIISYALGMVNAMDKSKAVMIGDREHDIIGAKKAGIDAIGILFGYGTRDELIQAGAKAIAKKACDIAELL